MTEKSKKYLLDIENSIVLIEEFTRDLNNFEQYLSDKKTKSAVERQLGIIGEAVNKYQKLNQQQPLMNSRKIITFRNWLIHAYDSIDDTTVWAVIRLHLPALLEEVRLRIVDKN